MKNIKEKESKGAMKKIFVCVVIVALFLCGCQSAEDTMENAENRTVIPVRLDYDGRNANEAMLKMWEAFDAKDRESIKELLSEEAISEIEECDSKIDSLLEFIQGEIVECEKYLLTSSKGRCAGKTQYEIEGGYIITTTEETYRFKFSFITRDDLNEGNTGIYRIDILTKELSESDKAWGGNDPDICVYTRAEE